MPRPRKVVTTKIDAVELHSSAIQRAIKLHSPFEIVAGDLVGRDPDVYCVVYTAPLGGDRKVMAERTVRANAKTLRDMLSEAWAEGMWSSGRT